MSEPILGYDLGTTNSAVVINSKGNDIEVVANERGNKLTPSIVKFSPDDTTVGQSAKNSAIAEPERVVQEVKREMGTEWTKETPEGDTYTPQEISAFILEKLKKAAERRLNKEAKKAVIGCPASFEEPAREATKRAGELAGFDEVVLITEPEAAVLSEFKNGEKLQGMVMTADLGGGTMDVSILEVDPPDVVTKTIEGDPNLGGIDFTNRLIEKAEEETGKIQEADLQQELQKRAENAKIDLSNQEKVSISVPTSDELVNIQFTQEELKELTETERSKVKTVCEDALDNVGLDWNDLSAQLLVGGAIKTPSIQEMFREIPGLNSRLSTWPDKAVAIGAGVKAADIQGRDILTEQGTYILPPSHQSVLSKSIGVKVIDGDTGEEKNEIILEKDSPLPATGKETFTTKEDKQTDVGITVLEGESHYPKNCNVLGEEDGQVLQNIPPQPAGVPRIELTLKMDEEGILAGEAIELNSGTPVKFRIELPELLSESEKNEATRRIANKS